MDVLVTGAAGGIGGGVARSLAAAGHDVLGVDRDAAGPADRLYDRLVRAGLPGGLLWRLLHR